MKVLFIFGLATFTLAGESDTSLLPPWKDKERLKNEITIESEPENISRVTKEWW